MMKIRKIEPRDFAIVAQLENENWPLTSTPHVMNSSAEKIIEKITKGMGYFIAEENGEILGVLDYGPRHKSEFGRHIITFGIMTVEKARGKGVATALITFFIDYARHEGYKKITIQVMGSNPTALKLYEKLGFVCEGRLRKEFFIDETYIDDCILAYYLDKTLL
ncbi:MAG: GNAT family N-acetyltransferase [Streptococcaceae bacterium]|nr:GNAT family N-acetyltransferase [Lactococcus protaetiae]MCL2112464.1 GNAT family N-acetyltransferase [Streptococcaceae bacterium]